MCWSCDNPGGDYLREVVLPTIDRAGWMVQYVDSSGPYASLAYTVGLVAIGRSELVVTGLDPVSSMRLLDAAARQPTGLHEGVQMSLEGRVLEVVRLLEPQTHLPVAAHLYGEALTALQLVYADGRGVWPWRRAFRDGRGGQPVLGAREAGLP